MQNYAAALTYKHPLNPLWLLWGSRFSFRNAHLRMFRGHAGVGIQLGRRFSLATEYVFTLRRTYRYNWDGLGDTFATPLHLTPTHGSLLKLKLSFSPWVSTSAELRFIYYPEYPRLYDLAPHLVMEAQW